MLMDRYNRKFKGQSVGWVTNMKCNRLANYRRVIGKDKKIFLFCDKKGMCDKNGIDIRNSKVKLIPVLIGTCEKEWVFFPNTKEAKQFKKNLTYNDTTYLNNKPVILNEFDFEELNNLTNEIYE